MEGSRLPFPPCQPKSEIGPTAPPPLVIKISEIGKPPLPLCQKSYFVEFKYYKEKKRKYAYESYFCMHRSTFKQPLSYTAASLLA